MIHENSSISVVVTGPKKLQLRQLFQVSIQLSCRGLAVTPVLLSTPPSTKQKRKGICKPMQCVVMFCPLVVFTVECDFGNPVKNLSHLFPLKLYLLTLQFQLLLHLLPLLNSLLDFYFS